MIKLKCYDVTPLILCLSLFGLSIFDCVHDKLSPPPCETVECIIDESETNDVTDPRTLYARSERFGIDYKHSLYQQDDKLLVLQESSIFVDKKANVVFAVKETPNYEISVLDDKAADYCIASLKSGNMSSNYTEIDTSLYDTPLGVFVKGAVNYETLLDTIYTLSDMCTPDKDCTIQENEDVICYTLNVDKGFKGEKLLDTLSQFNALRQIHVTIPKYITESGEKIRVSYVIQYTDVTYGTCTEVYDFDLINETIWSSWLEGINAFPTEDMTEFQKVYDKIMR